MLLQVVTAAPRLQAKLDGLGAGSIVSICAHAIVMAVLFWEGF